MTTAVEDRPDQVRADDALQFRAQAQRVDRSLRQHLARLEQHHVGRELQHLLELVTHVHHRDGEPVAQRLKVRQHFLAARHIERGERLVQQQQPRLRQQRAPERDALAFTAGELVRTAREQRLECRAARAPRQSR